MGLPEITAEQREKITAFLINLAKGIATAKPSLSAEVEGFQEMSKAEIGGVRLALGVLFGSATASAICEAATSTLRKQLGYEPELIPPAFDNAINSEQFKTWSQQGADWKPPRDDQ